VDVLSDLPLFSAAAEEEEQEVTSLLVPQVQSYVVVAEGVEHRRIVLKD